jgi:hypothetical protein
MMFEGWRVPDDDGDWVKYLRDVLTPPYSMRRQGDERPLDWVERFLKEHPDKTDAIADAYIELLREPDASRRAQILEQLPTFPIDLSDRLSGLVVSERASYSAQPDPLDESQTLLGRLVRTIDRVANTKGPSAEAGDVLATIRRKQDGWPESFLLALRSTFPKMVPQLVPSLEQMSADEQVEFAQRLTSETTPICERAFDEIGHTANESLRRRIGEAVRSFVRPDPELLRRYKLIAQEKPNMPAASTDDRWPELARRLRIGN